MASSCYVPRLGGAKGCHPCNPCAAKSPCNPCNPCAAKKMKGCHPCNPCAAKNPCNPCGAANPCNPCNPCGAGAAAAITDAEAGDAYACIKEALAKAYARAGVASVAGYQGWPAFNTVAYQSATHGGRYVNNYANATGAASYGRFENVGKMPVGSVLAKDSFAVGGDGAVSPGPLFVMEKMPAGFNSGSDDWKYTMIMPNGSLYGTTKGEGSSRVQFCVDCHVPLADMQDSLYFMPEKYRKH